MCVCVCVFVISVYIAYRAAMFKRWPMGFMLLLISACVRVKGAKMGAVLR